MSNTACSCCQVLLRSLSFALSCSSPFLTVDVSVTTQLTSSWWHAMALYSCHKQDLPSASWLLSYMFSYFSSQPSLSCFFRGKDDLFLTSLLSLHMCFDWVPHIFSWHPLHLPLPVWALNFYLVVFSIMHNQSQRSPGKRGKVSLCIVLLSPATSPSSSFYTQSSWKSRLRCPTSQSLLSPLQSGFGSHCAIRLHWQKSPVFQRVPSFPLPLPLFGSTSVLTWLIVTAWLLSLPPEFILFRFHFHIETKVIINLTVSQSGLKPFSSSLYLYSLAQLGSPASPQPFRPLPPGPQHSVL